MNEDVSKTNDPSAGCTDLLDADSQRVLLRFANLFMPVHDEISARGASQVTEYMELWHVFADEVRPILAASNASLTPAGKETGIHGND